MEGDPAGASPVAPGAADPDTALEDEVVRLRSELERAKRIRAGTTRRIATAVLAVVTTISVIAGTLAYWAHQTVFDQDHYMGVVAPLGADPAVTGALSSYLSGQIVSALDLKHRIDEALADIPQLPDKAQVLAGPIASAANDLVRRRVSEYVASQDFRNLWVQVNRVGHEKVVALLEGHYAKLPNVKVGDAEVRLDLLPFVSKVLRQLVQDGVARVAPGVTVPDVSVKEVPDSARQRLGQTLGVTLPPSFGEVTIMSRQKLNQLQGAVDRFNRLVWGLILLSILLAAATVAIAVNRRRALVELAIGIVVGLLLANVVIRKVKDAVVDRINSGQGKGAARAVMDETLGSLRDVAVVVLVAGAVIAVVAHLVGRPRWLTGSFAWLRRQATQAAGAGNRSRIAENADGLRIAVIALGLVVLFVTGIGVLVVLVVGGIGALLLWAIERVRRQALPVPDPDDGEEADPDRSPVGTGR